MLAALSTGLLSTPSYVSIYFARQDYARSLEALEKARAIHPRDDYEVALGVLYSRLGPSAHALGLQGGSETGGFASSGPGQARGPQPQYSPGVQAPGEWPSGARSLDEKLLFRIIQAAFALRRKTILNSLTASSPVRSSTFWQPILREAGIPENKRAEELDLNDYIRLAVLAKASSLDPWVCPAFSSGFLQPSPFIPLP